MDALFQNSDPNLPLSLTPSLISLQIVLSGAFRISLTHTIYSGEWNTTVGVYNRN